jgi:tetratricopeptide (TPR) repeat protein
MADSFMTMLFYRQAEADSLQIRGKRNMEAIPKIIKWMQGHPKALELTEKLLTSFPAAKIWADLQRHPVKGFSAVFATSIKHLTELQRTLFTHLSVFTIPFEWDAAYAVLPDAEEVAVDDALDVLVQRALVTFDGARYAYHALVRQYAYEQLQESKTDPREVHQKVAEYLHRKLADDKHDGTPEELLEKIDQWQKAENWKKFAEETHALMINLERLGYWTEIKQRLVQALATMDNHVEDVSLEAALLCDLGIIAYLHAEWDTAIRMYQQALDILKSINDMHSVAQIYNNLGTVYARRGNWTKASSMYHKDLEINEQLGNVQEIAQTLGNLGTVHAQKGESDRALELYRESLKKKKQIGDMRGIAQTQMNIGNVLRMRGEFDLALSQYKRSLRGFEHENAVFGIGQVLKNIGLLYYHSGQIEKSIPFLARASYVFIQFNSPHRHIAFQALVQSFDGDVDAANAYLAQVAEAMQETDDSSKP